jgi:hypothetical protein
VKYLGLPLRISFKAKSIWDGIIEKIEHCLAGWKRINGAWLDGIRFVLQFLKEGWGL